LKTISPKSGFGPYKYYWTTPTGDVLTDASIAACDDGIYSLTIVDEASRCKCSNVANVQNYFGFEIKPKYFVNGNCPEANQIKIPFIETPIIPGIDEQIPYAEICSADGCTELSTPELKLYLEFSTKPELTGLPTDYHVELCLVETNGCRLLRIENFNFNFEDGKYFCFILVL
jgi:hypothetical protein